MPGFPTCQQQSQKETTWPTTHRSAALAVLFAARADLVSWKQSKSDPVDPSVSATNKVQYRLQMQTMHTH